MALSRKAKQRITKLIEYMRTLPRAANDHFNMRWWVLHNGASDVEDTEHEFEAGVSKDKLLSCGTTACAAGWAATIPAFKRAGLRMELIDGKMRPSVDLGEFFDIDLDKEGDLFGGSNEDPTPRAWARRASKLLKDWSKRGPI